MLGSILSAEWCASPKGCYGETEPALDPSLSPLQPLGESDPLQEGLDTTISNGIDSLMNSAVWGIIKIGVAIAILIIVLVIIRKLFVIGTAKAKEMSDAIQHARDAAAHAGSSLSPEVLAADVARREMYKQKIEQEDAGNGVASFRSQMDADRQAYLKEVSKQDDIQERLEDSLRIPEDLTESNSFDDISAISEELSNQYDSNDDVFNTEKVEDIFASYNLDLKDTSYDNIEANVSNAARAFGASDKHVGQAQQLARKIRQHQETISNSGNKQKSSREAIEEELRQIARKQAQGR